MTSDQDVFPAAYRRLMLAYPRWYRRERAAEMLTTMLDEAPVGTRRPGLRHAVDVVVGGVRCRFRLPRGRESRAVAVVVAAFTGVLASAGAGLAVWQAMETVPTSAQAIAVARTAVPLPPVAPPRVGLDPLELNYGHRDLASPGLPAGADPGTGRFAFDYRVPPEKVAATARQARERLLAAGWRVGAVQQGPDDVKDGIVVPNENSDFWAARDDLVVQVEAIGGPIGDAPSIRVDVHHQISGRVTAAALAGMLTGLVAGWLVAGSMLRAHRRHQRRELRVLMEVGAAVGVPCAGLVVLIAGGLALGAAAEGGWNAQDSLAPAAAFLADTPVFPGGRELALVALACALIEAVLAALAPSTGGEVLPARTPGDRSPVH